MRARQSGFTLIVVAMLLVAMAIVASITLRNEAQTGLRKQQTTSFSKSADIYAALERYKEVNGNYPCPAPLNVSESQTGQYGLSTGDATSSTPCATGSGIESLGGNVVRGMVPVATLGINREMARDVWGNKVQYSVSRTGDKDVIINDGTGANIGNYEFILISTGEDSLGAWPADGTAKINNGCTGTDPRVANCDNDAIFVHQEARNTGDTPRAQYYDDIPFYSKVAAGGASGGCSPSPVEWFQLPVRCMGTVTRSHVYGDSAETVTDTTTDSTPRIEGTADATCRADGSFSVVGTCDSNCPSGLSVTWTDSGNTCSGSTTVVGHYHAAPNTNAVNDVTAPTTGSATFRCDEFGSWYQSGAASCVRSCPTQTLGWGGGCSASFAGINHGATSPSTNNTAGGYTGSATASCNNGSWSTPSGTCSSTSSPCSTSTLSWGAGCEASFAGIAHGATSPSTNNTASGYTGSATASCSNGTWSTPSGSCSSTTGPCSTQTLTWGAGCEASFAGIPHGDTSPSTTNTASGYTGSATASCSNGTWSTPSGSCSATPTCAAGWGPIVVLTSEAALVDCNSFRAGIGDCTSGEGGTSASTTGNTVMCATGITGSGTCNVRGRECGGSAPSPCSTQTLSWGAGCEASFAGIADGDTSPSTTNTASGYTGSATATCTAGVWGTPSGSCSSSSCSTQTLSWGAGCEASFAGIADGDTSPSTTNTASGYGGSATATCTAGVWGTPTGTCSAPSICTNPAYPQAITPLMASDPGNCPAACASDGYHAGGIFGGASCCCATGAPPQCSTATLTWGAGCSASFTTVMTGNPRTATNSAPGYTGSATATCFGTTWGAPSGTCTAAAPCSTATLNWGPGSACSASFSGVAHGSSSTGTDSTGPLTGSATANCTNGTWDTPSGTCTLGSGSMCTGGCDAAAQLGVAACCVAEGDEYETYGAGCRRYRCTSGTLIDIGAPMFCSTTPTCTAGIGP